MITCPRCNTPNPPHMRFCNNCGFQLGAVQGGAPAPAAASPYGAQPAPVCWRCRSLGESGADFCKFCGARYSDGAAQAAPPAPNLAAAVAGYGQQQPMQQQPMQQPVQPIQQQPMQQQPVMQQPAMQQQQPPMPASLPTAHVDPSPPASVARGVHGTLVAILKDGTDGRAYPIVDDPTDVGRTEGHVVLSDDPYLSPRHVRLVPRADGLLVRDLDSINGVYVRLREPVELNDGDVLLLGQQLMRFEVLPETELPLGPAMHRGVLVFGTPEVARLARLVQYTTEGVGRDVHYIYRDETVVGREQGDVVCTDDPFMSRRHAAIALDRSQRRFVLRDLGSSNGTAIRIRGERILKAGDQFRVGRHLFRYDRAGASA